jgi:hypothetical protein
MNVGMLMAVLVCSMLMPSYDNTIHQLSDRRSYATNSSAKLLCDGTSISLNPLNQWKLSLRTAAAFCEIIQF